MQLMCQEICRILPSLPEELEAIFNLNGVFGRPFYGLETRYMYNKTHYNFVVSENYV